MNTLSSLGMHDLIHPAVGELCGFSLSRSVSCSNEESSIAIKPGDDSGNKSLK
jgi:hypothetical protein